MLTIPPTLKRPLILAAEYFLVSVFTVAFLAKAFSFAEFRQSIEFSVISSPLFSLIFGVMTLLLEIGFVGLIIGGLRFLGFALGSLLSFSFLSFSIIRLCSGKVMACGCFGALFSLSPIQEFGLTAFLLALSALCLRSSVNQKRGPSNVGLKAAMICVTMFLVYQLCVPTINIRPPRPKGQDSKTEFAGDFRIQYKIVHSESKQLDSIEASILNIGSKPHHLTVKPSCRCIDVSWAEMDIRPNTTVLFTSQIRSAVPKASMYLLFRSNQEIGKFFYIFF